MKWEASIESFGRVDRGGKRGRGGGCIYEGTGGAGAEEGGSETTTGRLKETGLPEELFEVSFQNEGEGFGRMAW